MTFASLIIERPPLDWGGFFDALGQWLQDVGLYAFLWLGILLLSYLLVPDFRHRSPWSWLHKTMAALAGVGLAFLVVFLVLLATQGRVVDANAPRLIDAAQQQMQAKLGEPMTYTGQQKLFLSLAGLCALAACLVPLVRDLGQKRMIARRIWAIARVSIKEAWSRGIVWVCVIIPLIYLYA